MDLSAVTLASAQIIGVSGIVTVPIANYASWEGTGGIAVTADAPAYGRLSVGVSLEYGEQQNSFRDRRTRSIIPFGRISYTVSSTNAFLFSVFVGAGVDVVTYESTSGWTQSRESGFSYEPGIQFSVPVFRGFMVRGQLAYHVVRDARYIFESIRFPQGEHSGRGLPYTPEPRFA